MKKIQVALFVFALAVIIANPALCFGLDEQKKPVIIKVLKPEEWPIVTISGRLRQETHGNSAWLIFHAKDGQLYIVQGRLTEQLKGLLSDLGKDNIVTLTGKKEGSGNLSCNITYRIDATGQKTQDTQCIRYYNLSVIKFSGAQKSNQALPLPKRDTEEEKKTIATTMPALAGQEMVQYLTITGRVESINLRSPVKTIEVSYPDKYTHQPLLKALLISPQVRVVRKIAGDKQEYMDVGIHALKPGQEVTCMYSRGELKSEALFITITKD